MKYKIIADSSSNLGIIENNICEVVPLKIYADDMEFVDDPTLDTSSMISHLESHNGKSTTSCPNVDEWLTAFGDADTVFCVTITSSLSGSYNAACIAKDEYEKLHPDRRVFVIDTLSTGPEMKLIVEELHRLLNEGADFKTTCSEIMCYLKRTALLFSLESLKNLANNGRVSHTAAVIAGVLGIRVIGRASDKGELEPLAKCRGQKKTIDDILKHMKEMCFNGGKVRIDHCFNSEAAEQLKNKILSSFPSSSVIIGKTAGLCSFYAEKGGLLVGFEKQAAFP